MRLRRFDSRSAPGAGPITVGLLAALLLAGVVAPAEAESRPSILVITVDALRADRLGCYGYERPTSPAVDRLAAAGLRFDRAWTPEPLTAPAMCSMVTSLHPHQHGASRNGLRMQEGLESLPRVLARDGWQTAAFVGTWTLRDKLTLLGDHFETYGERLEKKRWFGLVNSEATAEDVTDDALQWLERARGMQPDRPFFLWVHYIEPHAPYIFHDEFAQRLGIGGRDVSKSDRYDTEIAAVDRTIARLLEGVRSQVADEDLIVVFTADHGESLGEHDYWGHGRHLYEPSLRIPLVLHWPGRIAPGTVEQQVTLLDLAPTLLELVGLQPPEGFVGTSLASTALHGEPFPERRGCYQAHRGAVHLASHDSERKRSRGLLAVAVVENGRKEVLYVLDNRHLLFDLREDPGELRNLVEADSRPSRELLTCLADVSEGLGALDRLAAQELDEETVERLRALGYLE